MQKDSTPLHDCATPKKQTEIDYAPKSYTFGEHIPILLKFIAIASIIFLIFWFYESK